MRENRLRKEVSMNRTIPCLVICLFLAAGGGNLLAASCVGVSFPDTLDLGGQELLLNGLGLREATIFSVDVYVAALYVGKKSTEGPAILADEGAKRLILHFVRKVGKGKITEAWDEGFVKNGAAASLSDARSKLNAMMDDMKPGETMSFTYTPESGLEVSVKGEAKGTIAGADFAREFFAIWLGPAPPNPGLKTGLLGAPCG